MLLLLGLVWIVWLIENTTPLMVLGLGLGFALVIDGIVAFRSARIRSVSLHPVGSPCAGEPTRWQLEVDGVRRPIILRSAELPGHAGWFVRGDDAGIVTLPPLQRGVLHVLLFDAVATGGVGLWRAGRRLSCRFPEPVAVVPRPLAFPVRWPQPRSVGFALEERAVRGDDLFRGIRPYVHGDEQRRIHWKATARHGELMVREDEGTGVVSLQVLVDPGPAGPIADQVVARAAWLVETVLHRGWVVQLVTADLELPPPRYAALGRPLGRPPIIVPPPPLRPVVAASMVHRLADVREQLATASAASGEAPRWHGLVAVVSPDGITWR